MTRILTALAALPIAAASTLALAGPASADPPVNTIIGTLGDDVLIGTNHTDLILGFRGNDRLVGLEKSDFLSGGRGRDVLRGGGFHSGRDLLRGGPGRDRCFGERALDRFVGCEVITYRVATP